MTNDENDERDERDERGDGALRVRIVADLEPFAEAIRQARTAPLRYTA